MIGGGQIISILEIIVTTYCGIQLGFRPCKMRWNHWAAKVLFGVLVGIWITLRIINVFYTKFAGIEYVFTGVYYCLLIILFFNIGFLRAFVQSVIYWQSIMVLQALVIYFCSTKERVTFLDYIGATQPWHWVHLGVTVCIIIVSVVLHQRKKGKAFVELRFRREYILVAGILLIVAIFYNLIFDNARVPNTGSQKDFVLVVFFVLVLNSLGILLWVYKAYQDMKYKSLMVTNDYNQVSTQYQLLQELHEEKRRQIHDSVQRNILLAGYLKNNQIEEAKRYLAGITDQMIQEKAPAFTGIPVIDIMLGYKRNAAQQLGIIFAMKLDVLFCPIALSDMCVLLGNLLDNAIEAVQALEVGQRRIFIKIITVNQIFTMQISNLYEGRRRKTDGKYQTTKKKRTLHGIGLASVSQIVERCGGIMEIRDNDACFKITITFFEKIN